MTDPNPFTPVEQPKKKSAPIAMIFTTVILAAALIFLVVTYFDQKNKMVEMETVLTQEKDSLANELRLMVHGYDTLKTDNDTLMANLQREKKRIVQLLSVNATNVELSKAKEELSTKVTVASIIQAKDINAVTLNKKRKETTRLNLIDKLRICFTLRENPIAAAGEKEVFMRVIRPDSLIITNSPENLFDFNGNKLVYSASRLVDYMNQDIEMCIFLDNTG